MSTALCGRAFRGPADRSDRRHRRRVEDRGVRRRAGRPEVVPGAGRAPGFVGAGQPADRPRHRLFAQALRQHLEARVDSAVRVDTGIGLAGIGLRREPGRGAGVRVGRLGPRPVLLVRRHRTGRARIRGSRSTRAHFRPGSGTTSALPVADDWLARFGYLPVITGIVFVNDRDTDPRASVWFDEVLDVTADLPVAPLADIWHSIGRPFGGRAGRRASRCGSTPASSTRTAAGTAIRWRFGDGGTAWIRTRRHVYTVEDNHEYNVLLEVEDSTGLFGRATCPVRVDSGPTTFPVRLNFVGDIMLARRYEDPGGIIDTLGRRGHLRAHEAALGEAADITVANLESPLTAQGTRHPTKPIVFRGRPEQRRRPGLRRHRRGITRQQPRGRLRA